MQIQFEIREQLPDIISEILNSDKWHTHVIEEKETLKRISIKDPYFDSKASVEIWQNEIHIRTAWSNYTYRIFEKDGSVWCEYIGAYRGLLEQTLLPRLTPKENFLDAEVTNSSLLDGEKESLLKYSKENVKQKHSRPDKERKKPLSDHPRVVCDEFIKIGVPLPPPL